VQLSNGTEQQMPGVSIPGFWYNCVVRRPASEVGLMVFQIELTIEAVDDLKSFRKYDQQRVVSVIDSQLSTQATTPSRNRKLLRVNTLAEWELRAGDFRVFYDVDAPQAIVTIKAIGEKKGDALIIRGEVFEL
jgi:mRNA-degrading endonuclease RelE of RelBE toxin-antitoxin system